jgi:hypothetical protein
LQDGIFISFFGKERHFQNNLKCFQAVHDIYKRRESHNLILFEAVIEKLCGWIEKGECHLFLRIYPYDGARRQVDSSPSPYPSLLLRRIFDPQGRGD